ncbi:MAG: hypothetical protein RL181_1017 [Bacteroidota bacterium]
MTVLVRCLVIYLGQDAQYLLFAVVGEQTKHIYREAVFMAVQDRSFFSLFKTFFKTFLTAFFETFLSPFSRPSSRIASYNIMTSGFLTEGSAATMAWNCSRPIGTNLR